MIAFIAPDRCTDCGVCVAICPTNVLDAASSTPLIARPDDCETCFLCELYCEADAIYVDPNCDQAVSVDPGAIVEAGLMGSFRRDSGWHEWEGDPLYSNEHWRLGELFARAQAIAADPEPGRARGEPT